MIVVISLLNHRAEKAAKILKSQESTKPEALNNL